MLESHFNKVEGLGLQLYSKEIPTQMLSYEICDIFKNTYFEEHLRMPAYVTYELILALIHIRVMFPFWPLENRKSFDLLMFSGGIKRNIALK